MTEKLSKAVTAWLDTPAWARAEVMQVPRNAAARALFDERNYRRELDALDTEMSRRMLGRRSTVKKLEVPAPEPTEDEKKAMAEDRAKYERAKRIIDPVIIDACDTVASMSASAALLEACDANGEPDESVLEAWAEAPPIDRDMLAAHAHMHAALHVERAQKHRASTIVAGALSCGRAARAEEDIAAAFAAAAGILEASAEERT